jgi:acyl transferase domain-containing protein
LIKAVLTLENKMIPPNIKFHTPNPGSRSLVQFILQNMILIYTLVPFKEKGLVIPVIPTSFPTNKSERISVSSYGIGGSNAHVC